MSSHKDDNLGRARAAKQMILENGPNNAARLGCLSLACVTTRVPIGIVDMGQASSLTFAEPNELATPKAMSDSQAVCSSL